MNLVFISNHDKLDFPLPFYTYKCLFNFLLFKIYFVLIDVNRDIFPSHVRLYVQNDAVAALASGTMGKLHGCVLIAGTGTIPYGFTVDGREARAAGAGPILGDWGSYRLCH